MENKDYQFTHISTDTTTTVKGEAGFLGSIIVNTPALTTGTATVYDGDVATGDVIAVINTLLTQGSLDFNVRLKKGLTIVTAATTPADITVTWK